jgi:hypothetical protein
MTQTELANAVDKIEGYHLPRPNESEHQSFERAKEEALTHLRAQLAHVESITLSHFQAARRRR